MEFFYVAMVTLNIYYCLKVSLGLAQIHQENGRTEFRYSLASLNKRKYLHSFFLVLLPVAISLTINVLLETGIITNFLDLVLKTILNALVIVLYAWVYHKFVEEFSRFGDLEMTHLHGEKQKMFY